MMKYLLSIFFLLIPLMSHSQALWLEGGGGTPSYALQYEQPLSRFGRQGIAYAGRIGVGVEPTRVAVPISIHAWTGSQAHHLAFMVGATAQMRDLDQTDTDTYLLLTAGAGYRYQHPNSRLMLSFMAHPLVITDPTPVRLIDPNPALRFRLSAGVGLQL